MRNLNFALTWYVTTICTLTLSLFLLTYFSFTKVISTPVGQQYQMYKALPGDLGTLGKQEEEIGKVDARAIIVTNFFKQKRAPLASSAEKFIEVADRYNLDYRLLPAIAMQESNGGKIIPSNSFNPFGYGIYGGKVIRFSSFEEAIERVGKELREDYINQGLKTPSQIMTKYTPPSVEKGGPWAMGVTVFMEQM